MELINDKLMELNIKKRGSTRFAANIASRHLPKKHYYLIAYIIQTL